MVPAMRTINAAEIQTRTSPFGYYATHLPCGAVLTAQYHHTARDAYDDSVVTMRGHVCPADR
jgi:hypothetical protein